jgi:uncharacterized protein (DUF1697 family)
MADIGGILSCRRESGSQGGCGAGQILMPAYVAFLRGINVGGNKTVPMARLKALFEALGFTSVKTHLNSGNVVFASGEKDRAKLTENIEAAVEKEFGFRPTTMLRDAAALKKVVAKNPFPAMAEDGPSHLVVMLLAAKPDKDAAKRLAAAYQGIEEIKIAGEEAYVTYPNGIGKSKLTNVLLEKQFGVAGTARNWNTVTKLLAMAEAVGDEP